MKVTIIGYGKMGKEIEKVLLQAGHTVVATIDNEQEWEERLEIFLQSDVAIEFSMPQTVIANLNRCFKHHIPVVSGTTGWQDQRDAKRRTARWCTVPILALAPTCFLPSMRRWRR